MGTEIRTTSSTGGQKGTKEERHDLIPIGPLRELATHFGRGALKYDVHQWRKGYEWSKSYSALDRHLKLFWSGEDYDICSNEPENCLFEHPEDGRAWPKPDTDTCWNHTGSHHLVAVAWHSFVLLEFKDRFPDFDDRFKIEKSPGEKIDETNYISYEDVVKAMHESDLTAVTEQWILDRFGEGRITPWSETHYRSLMGKNRFASSEPLSWVSQHTGEKQPVCVCSEDERAEQDSLVTHYRIIHGIKL
jgi:hypothetical protein